ITYLDMSVEDAVKLVVSGGIVTPPYKEPKTSKRQTVKNKRKGTKAKADTKAAKAIRSGKK
ncbi:MAG: hypothetical protein ACPHDJ_06730, partial [Candidatus Puniceispirillaceae bacterium]